MYVSKAVNSSGQGVALKTRLAESLRWLAGGSYLDLCFAQGLGLSTFYDTDNGILWRTLQATDVVLPMGFPINGERKLEELSQGFSHHSAGICASCDHSGSTNDVIAWQDSLLFQMVEVEKLLLSKYFFIGDEAFNTMQQFLSPWPGKSHFICLLRN